MNDDSADQLLDEIAQRTRELPVPQYPVSLIKNVESAAHSVSPLTTTPAPQRRRAAVLTLVCSLISCCVVAICLHSTLPAKPETAFESAGPRLGPATTVTVDPSPMLDHMTAGIKELNEQLDQIEIEIARQEVSAAADALLAEFRPSNSQRR